MKRLQSGRLRFLRGNAKVGRDVWTFSLPAGWSCPGALQCLARADKVTGKITDGAKQLFRCFAASMEARSPHIRASRWHNMKQLQDARGTLAKAALIESSLPKSAAKVRIHVSGDFFSLEYLMAWVIVARHRPDVLFYAYTKSVEILERYLGAGYTLPPNLKLTISYGGRHDDRLMPRPANRIPGPHGRGIQRLPRSLVVFTPPTHLPVDHDDSYAQHGARDYALLLHGSQPAGTTASAALMGLRRAGQGGYSGGQK